ncbi:MAG: RNA methyltransferase [Saprospiraceae bacterium]|nr:RNA methyltransferase [Saprospiraceae bacterium]
MISKAKIKDIKALHLSKFRQIYNKFIAEGDKVCIELIKNTKYNLNQVFITQGYEGKYSKYLKDTTAEIEIISPKEMEQISLLKTPSDIFLLLEIKEDNTNDLLKPESSVIYLDGVQDPGNVGTIIRIADWFGIDAVVRSEDSADFFNPKVVQASMGSMVNVKLVTSDLQQTITKEKSVYGTFMNGISIKDVEIPKGSILVMGSEGRGISPQNEKLINHKITILGSSNKIAESLNVAVATSIICAAWKV